MRLNYDDLSHFTKGYVDAMFFTECHCDSPELEDKGYSDLADETITKIVEDCAGFEMLHENLIRRAFFKSNTKYTTEQAGHDFWLTRNGHGAGFWDRGLGEIGNKLTEACGHGTKYPNLDLYLGDDNKLYLA